MRHGYSGLLAGDMWMAGTVFLVFVILIAGVIWFSHKKRVASDGLTTKERKELGYPESEILSMLRQHGGPMMQREVIESLPDDLEELAGILNDMEAKGLIHRQWLSDGGTYSVTAWKK